MKLTKLSQQPKSILLINGAATLKHYIQTQKQSSYRWTGLLFHIAFSNAAKQYRDITGGVGPLGH